MVIILALPISSYRTVSCYDVDLSRTPACALNRLSFFYQSTFFFFGFPLRAVYPSFRKGADESRWMCPASACQITHVCAFYFYIEKKKKRKRQSYVHHKRIRSKSKYPCLFILLFSRIRTFLYFFFSSLGFFTFFFIPSSQTCKHTENRKASKVQRHECLRFLRTLFLFFFADILSASAEADFHFHMRSFLSQRSLQLPNEKERKSFTRQKRHLLDRNSSLLACPG